VLQPVAVEVQLLQRRKVSKRLKRHSVVAEVEMGEAREEGEVLGNNRRDAAALEHHLLRLFWVLYPRCFQQDKAVENNSRLRRQRGRSRRRRGPNEGALPTWNRLRRRVQLQVADQRSTLALFERSQRR